MKQPTNPYPEDITPDGRCYGPARIWEDACRAYEEALKATGRYIKGREVAADDSELKFTIENRAGWWVFLPDEKQEEAQE